MKRRETNACTVWWVWRQSLLAFCMCIDMHRCDRPAPQTAVRFELDFVELWPIKNFYYSILLFHIYYSNLKLSNTSRVPNTRLAFNIRVGVQVKCFNRRRVSFTSGISSIRRVLNTARGFEYIQIDAGSLIQAGLLTYAGVRVKCYNRRRGFC